MVLTGVTVLTTLPEMVETRGDEVDDTVPADVVEVALTRTASMPDQQYLVKRLTHAGVLSTPVLPRVLSTTAHASAVGHRGSAPPVELRNPL